MFKILFLLKSGVYEYLALQDGQSIKFNVDIPLSILFEMRVKIDGIEVAYKKIKMSDIHYYECDTIESIGLAPANGIEYMGGEIQFKYKE